MKEMNKQILKYDCAVKILLDNKISDQSKNLIETVKKH